ncbi:MAG TPA: hypothetical protein VFE58_08000 [Tepidisphaeraceae bacterium]|jgi:hypothetical protein|nr:hypothetical protein [Tepidisphaeraceae bacterium]
MDCTKWIVLLMFVAGVARADEFADLAAKHPAAKEIKHLSDPPAADFHVTGVTRKDYLTLIAGNVDYWKHFQDADGAIIDPFEKRERQYSTPAFALASAILVQEAGRKDLLEPSVRAFSFALTALAKGTTADQHADFYIPMLMHTHRILVNQVSREVAADWEGKLRGLVPEKVYRDVSGGGNWNLVNVSGELMRRKDGLVNPAELEGQSAYIERSITKQRRSFTKYGMYRDPNSPMAYDAFPRLWLEDMMADGAYDGPQAEAVNEFLRLGGISTLMLLSPSGEWATGGRSANHQWNEAAVAVICECNAAYWKKHGNDEVAGTFKRAAHLCLESLRRWQRPSGELWIVKNYADPASRFGFEGYSFNSQYNLLPMAMLAIAYERADDAIVETAKPGEMNSYVFDVREIFHKVVACVEGNYVEIETAADPHYNSTGLQRVQKSGVALSPLTDSVAEHRAYEGAGAEVTGGLTPGIQWQEKVGGRWYSLADFMSDRDGVDPKDPPTEVSGEAKFLPQTMAVRVGQRGFELKYELKGEGSRPVTEDYSISKDAVEVSSEVGGEVAGARVALPVMVSDGVHATKVEIDGAKVRVERVGGAATFEVIEPAGVRLELIEPKMATHNGYVQAAVGDLPAGTLKVRWKVTVEAVK